MNQQHHVGTSMSVRRAVHQTLRVLLVLTTLGAAGGGRCGQEHAAPALRGKGTRTVSPAAGPTLKLFEKGFKEGWQDWGWATREIDDGTEARLNLEGYGGWIVANSQFEGAAKGLGFDVKAPAQFGDFLEVRVSNSSDPGMAAVRIEARHRRPLANGWEEVYVDMKELNPNGLRFDRVIFRAHAKVSDEWVMFDNLRLHDVDLEPKVPLKDDVVEIKPARNACVTVACDSPNTPINPLIYGIAYSPRTDEDDQYLWELRPTARRWGGNPTSRFNWKLGNAWNTADDYFFMNVNYTGDDSYTWADFLKENAKRGVQSIITVPLLGWVAKDTTSTAFPVKKFGDQEATTTKSGVETGNGKKESGDEIKPGPPTLTSVPASPEFVAGWVKEINKLDQKSGRRHVASYILDNEPMLWSHTHRDVHPQATGYDELLKRTIDYGTAVRKADPKARIAGPAVWGWPAYFFSDIDARAGFDKKPDRKAHGDVPLLAWYLRSLRDHEKKTGVKVLDILDVHFYPQGAYNDKVDRDTAGKRVRMTRSLWDDSYTDESWVNDKIRLIPRMKELIDQNYPGLGFSIGEYNFGGEEHISGALALAEALGRFGEYGVESAYYWTYPDDKSHAYWAFRAYRDYDGKGSRFLDFSVPSKGADDLSLFASTDAKKKKVVAVLVNMQPSPARTSVRLRGCGKAQKAKRFSLTEESKGLVKGDIDVREKGGVVYAEIPPSSVTVVEVDLQ